MNSSPESLDTSNNRELDKVYRMSIDEVMVAYHRPPKDKDGYISMRSYPVVWSECTDRFHRDYVGLHSCCLAKSNQDISDLLEVRAKAKEVCEQSVGESGLLWLAMRPRFVTTMSSVPSRLNFPVWDSSIRDGMSSLAHRCNVSVKSLLVVFSCKSMLTTCEDLGSWRSALLQEVNQWDSWIREEIRRISQNFRLV